VTKAELLRDLEAAISKAWSLIERLDELEAEQYPTESGRALIQVLRQLLKSISGELESVYSQLGSETIRPKYTGILTLELVNSGDVAVCLYPGSPIAQVAFSHVKSTSSERDRRTELSGGRYRCSIEPSFSLLRDDPCWSAIRRMRNGDDDA